MKSNRLGIIVIVILFAAIIAGAWYVIASPAPMRSATTNPAHEIYIVASTTTSTSTIAVATSTTPSDATIPGSVTISSPLSNATVGKSFVVAGVAPNNWYFEAVLPIQVDDADGKLIASAQGAAQSDWTVVGPVAFIATVTITGNYSGPANLIVKRDNPSGLIKNDAEIIVPIVINTGTK